MVPLLTATIMHALIEHCKISFSFAYLQLAKSNMILQRCHWQQHSAAVYRMHCRAQLAVYQAVLPTQTSALYSNDTTYNLLTQHI